MGFTSENLITNTAAVVLLWIWVHLFYKRYVLKGPVNWSASSSSISSMGSSDISVWKGEKIGYNIALSHLQQINHVIDSESHWGISFPEGQHTSIWISTFSKSFPSIWLLFGVWSFASSISLISWKFPPLYVRDPQLWTGLGWNIGERFFDPLKSKVFIVYSFMPKTYKCKT
jgi:hypothetical protein